MATPDEEARTERDALMQFSRSVIEHVHKQMAVLPKEQPTMPTPSVSEFLTRAAELVEAERRGEARVRQEVALEFDAILLRIEPRNTESEYMKGYRHAIRHALDCVRAQQAAKEPQR